MVSAVVLLDIGTARVVNRSNDEPLGLRIHRLFPKATLVTITDLPLTSLPKDPKESRIAVFYVHDRRIIRTVLPTLREMTRSIPVLGIFPEEFLEMDDIGWAFENGMSDFIIPPVCDAELVSRVEGLMKKADAVSSVGKTCIESQALCETLLIGESPCFKKTVQLLYRLASTDITTLITGETGTGKELFARAIHYHSPRTAGPFVPVNCGALPDHLCENELFGHAKGAFTDASTAEKGLIAEAENGTLFLDEIDALSHAVQSKLLRFLQNGEYKPLGSSKICKANVRVLAASNVDLRVLVNAKQFREDLYFRLRIASLCLPALKERVGDTAILANYFVHRYAKQYQRQECGLSPAAIDKLERYRWPGNVRELEAAIQRAVLLAPSSIIRPDDIDISAGGQIPEEGGTLVKSKREIVSQFERNYLVNLMKLHKGNVTHSARAAGQDRRVFQRMLRKYQLSRESFLSLS